MNAQQNVKIGIQTDRLLVAGLCLGQFAQRPAAGSHVVVIPRLLAVQQNCAAEVFKGHFVLVEMKRQAPQLMPGLRPAHVACRTTC